MRRACHLLVLLTPLLLCPSVCLSSPVISDLFGRDASVGGLTLPDWEGYMANPTIELVITPPAGAEMPVKVTILGNDPRLCFDLPSEAGSEGPKKELTLSSPDPQSVFVAAFPARQKHLAQAMLAASFVDARGRRGVIRVPVRIVPIESHDASPTYPITVDFSQDRTGFFNNPVHRSTFEQAVRDWAYYLADMHTDPVAAGAEKTSIFEPEGFARSHIVTNARPYTGYLMYAYGIHGQEKRAGGEPSGAGKWQTVDGKPLDVRRSGGVEVDIRGNYNTIGWMPPIPDQQWWRATNLGDVQMDLYSIVHHEMGHALFFNPSNRRFPRNGVLKDDAVREYLGSEARTDVHDHLDGIIDPWSLHGGFGNEYHGKFPYGRWLITRLDLLCARAVGYKLRRTAPFIPLSIRTGKLADAVHWKPYDAPLAAEGGIPFYDWTISQGELPPGMALNRITGAITGTPRKVGRFAFTVMLRDYQRNAQGISRGFVINVSGR